MNWYFFAPNDQVCNNWIVFTEHPNAEPVLRPRDAYRHLVCGRCGRFDHDKVFDVGFDGSFRIQGRGDIIETADGFSCINESFGSLVRKRRWKGLRLKPLGNSGWYVCNAAMRVPTTPDALDIRPSRCPVCARPSPVTGGFDLLRQVVVPTESSTFFSTQIDRSCYGFAERELLATEDIVMELKRAGLKGGYFQKLLTDEEANGLATSIAKGRRRWPAHSKIYL